MKIRIDQLKAHLEGSLAGCYLVSGDEPLQRLEASDLIRRKARTRGYETRELVEVESQPDWENFRMLALEHSLFSQKRILELRLGQKPDRAGQTLLPQLAASPSEETLLLILLPKLSGKEQQSAWFKALEKNAIHLPVWPIEGPALLRWLDQRLTDRGLLADQSGLRLLAARIEGNLLAANQEIEKLFMLHGTGQLTDRMIREAVAHHARYSVYDLAEELLNGRPGRLHQVIRGLQQEGVASPVALWAVTRELRLLHRLKTALARGEDYDQLANRHRLWDAHKQSLSKALKRLSLEDIRKALLAAGEVDQMTKGLAPGDPWTALFVLCTSLLQGAESSAVPSSTALRPST